MRYLFTGKQSQELDQHAIYTVGFPGLVLMEKAAMTLATIILERENPDTGILILCGTGNNGGDGVATARLLHQQGFRVAVCIIGEPEKLSSDAQKQLELALACDVTIVPEEYVFSEGYRVIVDGLFGVGLSRDIGGVYEKVIRDINTSGKKVYAIDIPSGINGDNGKIMNVAVKADVTVTFGVNKLGLVLYPGCEYAGEVIVGDIGYPQVSYKTIRNPVFYYEPEDLSWIIPKRKPDGHKGTFGHVFIIGGCESMSGAVLLAAKAAYSAGAGLVKVCSSRNNREILLSGCPELLYECYGEKDNEPNYEVLNQGIDFADVIVLGPGLGTGSRAQKIVDYVLKYCDKPLILDGDGITLCDLQLLQGRKNVIITPHPKEFATLLNEEVSSLKEQLQEKTMECAKENECIVVAKDARTFVSDGNKIYLNVSGNSGMGTGGSGDVLTGVIAAFVAQKTDLFQAATAGVYIHGLAGDYFAEQYNEYAVTAMALVESLKYVLV